MAIHGLDWVAALAPLAGFPDPPAARESRARVEPGMVRDLVTRFLDWQAQRQTVRILSSVDRATLRDLGIADIESEVYGDPKDRMRGYDPGWWRKP